MHPFLVAALLSAAPVATSAAPPADAPAAAPQTAAPSGAPPADAAASPAEPQAPKMKAHAAAKKQPVPKDATSDAVAIDPALAEAAAKAPPPQKFDPTRDNDKEAALGVARTFEEALLRDDPHRAVTLSSFPFMLEDKRFDRSEDLMAEWIRQLHGRRLDLLTLYGIDVLTPAEMEQRFGKPPTRLQSFPKASAHFFYAVANVSGHAAVLAIKQVDIGEWRVVGYTD